MANKKKLTDEELEAIKADLKKEIMAEMKEKETQEQPKTEFKIPTKSKIDRFDRNITNEKPAQIENVTKSSNMILIVVLLIVAAGIYIVPKVSELLDKKEEPVPTKEEKKQITPKEKVEYTWENDMVKAITLPIMRNNKYSHESYYQNKAMTIEDFSNNDILYNAFVNVYSGNIATYNEGYDRQFCGAENQRKTFNAKYIDARVNNLFTKDAKYTLTDFYVPLSANTPYVGTWVYDSVNNRYIYYGECNKNMDTTTTYLDILVEDDIKTSEDSKTAYLTYGIGFAKVINNNYEIYSDSTYNNLILSGTLETNNVETELKKELKKANDNKKLNKYQYTYSTKNCSYSELCYISGKWLDE